MHPSLIHQSCITTHRCLLTIVNNSMEAEQQALLSLESAFHTKFVYKKTATAYMHRKDVIRSSEEQRLFPVELAACCYFCEHERRVICIYGGVVWRGCSLS